ncbi:MAG TPA: hypothetical protein VMG35_03930 [Bryobacteraceae bacterium]|nr:hypothetical protein [Bryobacteraceae bacterium]
MGGGEDPRENLQRDALLAGLEAGILAALILLGWLALASAWYRRSIWSAANIMATTFYGEAALSRSFSSRTVAGIALYLVIYGTIGALFGLTLASREAGLRTTMIGVLVGLGWYYLSFAILWQNINPLIPLYTHRGPMIAGHVLYGGLLGRFPRYLRRAPAGSHAG